MERAWLRESYLAPQHVSSSQDIHESGSIDPGAKLESLPPGFNIDSVGMRHLGHGLKPRVHRVIVFERLNSIENIVSANAGPGTTPADTFTDCFLQTIDTLKWLFVTAGIVHRDISLADLLWWQASHCSPPILVITEHDMGPNEKIKHITGTPTFMSIGLLKTKLGGWHFLRYSLESAYYVFFYVATRYGGGSEDKAALEEWTASCPADMIWVKKDFLQHLPYLTFGEPFAPLARIFAEVGVLLYRGYRAQEDAIFDRALAKSRTDGPNIAPEFRNATLGGHVTFEKIREILLRPPQDPLGMLDITTEIWEDSDPEPLEDV